MLPLSPVRPLARSALAALGPVALGLAALGLAACATDDGAPDGAPGDEALLVFEGTGELIDDGAGSPGFSAFRDSLRAIVARRDTSALLALVAEDAQLSYDDAPGGPDGFRAMWFEATPPEPIWTVFDRILAAGSVEEDGAFTVPFVAGLWPEELDPGAHVVAVGDSVLALDRPGGTPLARLAGVHTLALSDSADAASWHVLLPDGRDAYIDRAQAASPIGYRATFWPSEGADYQLHVFVSGA